MTIHFLRMCCLNIGFERRWLLKAFNPVVLCLLSSNGLIAQTIPDVQIAAAIEYVDLPPEMRSRDEAVQRIETLLPGVQDPALSQQLVLRIARLYGQSYNHQTEGPKNELARAFYEKVLSANAGYSLELISARMELADLIGLGRDHADLYKLYKDVIKVDPQLIVSGELTPNQIERMNELHPREIAGGLTQDSPQHRKIVEKRMKQAADSILGRYKVYRSVATENLAHQVYVDSGLPGLQALTEEFASDKDILEILTRKIQKSTMETWDQNLHQ